MTSTVADALLEAMVAQEGGHDSCGGTNGFSRKAGKRQSVVFQTCDSGLILQLICGPIIHLLNFNSELLGHVHFRFDGQLLTDNLRNNDVANVVRTGKRCSHYEASCVD